MALAPALSALLLLLLLLAVAGAGAGRRASSRDFIAQNDLFNVTFPCSDAEKSCLEEDRVYFERDRRCYRLWRGEPCAPGHWLVIDKDEALNGSGRFQAACSPVSRCPARHVLMSFDQRCHSFAQIIREVCPQHAGLHLSYNIFGEGECKCLNCPPPQLPTNTFNEGRCAFPPTFYRRVSAVPVSASAGASSPSLPAAADQSLEV